MFRSRFAGVIGNVLEHYDHALFGLLAPFIAPLFFDNKDPLTALILTYAMLPLGLLSRPLGSLFFGWIGDRLGRREALGFSLMGMAIATVGIGCLPTYQQIGQMAPLLLALGKMLQSFCAAGEVMGGAIFVLERTSADKRCVMSSLYGASSIVGILIASALVTFSSMHEWMEAGGWRLLFWGGGLTAVFGVLIRCNAREGNEFDCAEQAGFRLCEVLRLNRVPLLKIVFASGFSYATYAVPFTLMNGYIPLVTAFSKTEVMQVNTLLLLVDLALLPCFGYLSRKLGKRRVMCSAALCSALFAVPLFSLLEGGSWGVVVAVRFGIVVLGVAFAAPYYAWAVEQVTPQHRYTILSLGGALGAQLIGLPTAALSLWLFQKMGWVGAPGFYLLAAAALGTCSVWQVKKSSLRLSALP